MSVGGGKGGSPSGSPLTHSLTHTLTHFHSPTLDQPLWPAPEGKKLEGIVCTVARWLLARHDGTRRADFRDEGLVQERKVKVLTRNFEFVFCLSRFAFNS